MFERILVPLDGSRKSETAVLAAETLSRKFAGTPSGATRGEIILLYVNEPHAPRRIHGEHHLQGVNEAQSYLEALAEKTRSRGFSVKWHVHESTERDVALGIALHDREMNPDLIVVSSHGAKGSSPTVHRKRRPAHCQRFGRAGVHCALRLEADGNGFSLSWHPRSPRRPDIARSRASGRAKARDALPGRDSSHAHRSDLQHRRR